MATLREKSGLLRVTAYILPAASRDTARRAWETPSCYYPQAKLKLMGGVSIFESESVIIGCGLGYYGRVVYAILSLYIR